MSTFQAKPYSEVFRRVFDLPSHGMTRALAESLLTLDFPEADAERIAVLSSAANEGVLTEAEEAELEAYINIGALLAYWQSKARQTLARPA